MRRSAPLFLLTLLLLTVVASGCNGGSAKNPLLGTWAMDAEGMKETTDYKEATEPERQQMEMMLGMMQLQVTFTETEMQSSVTMMGKEETSVDTYTLEKAGGGKWKVTSTDKDGVVTVATAKVDGDRMEVTDDKEGTFVLKRK